MTTKADILRAIRQKCLDCSCYQPSEVRDCRLTGSACGPSGSGLDPDPSRSRGFAKGGGYTGDNPLLGQRELSICLPCPAIRQIPRLHMRFSGAACRPHPLIRSEAEMAALPTSPIEVRRQVEAMAGYGVPEADIAGVVGVVSEDARKHYRGELDHGHVKANAKVAENLYRKATGEGREGRSSG